MKKIILSFLAQSLFVGFINLYTCFSLGAASGDFSQDPDAIITSKSLSSLPKDIIKVPLLNDILTEDFVFYYRDSGADWLSFRGALARIAFERKTDWPTRLLSWLLNGPAEIALWKAPDGKLNHFMVVIDQTGVKAFFESVAKVMGGAADSQFSEVKTSDGRTVRALNLATEKTIYMTSAENLLFIYSDLNMKIPDAGGARGLKDRLLSFFGASDEIAIFGPKLGKSTHVLTLTAKYFSFGYQAFFESIKAIQFDFKSEEWQSRVLMAKGVKTVEAKDWSQMPKGAALCAAVPIDKKKIETIVKVAKWLQMAGDTAVACWYPDSKFYTPVIALSGDYAALLKKGEELKPIFSNLIGSREAAWVLSTNEEEPATLVYRPKLAVQMEKTDSKLVLSREVGGRFGIHPASKSKDFAKLGSRRFFRVKLAITPESIIFSPDDQLVDQSLLTLQGKFPSMASTLPAKGETSLVVSPEALAKLAKTAVLDSLPASQESIFRAAVARHLFPNLENFAKRPLQAASLGEPLRDVKTASELQWKKVDWTTNAIK